jgi:hypothetical protein
MYWGKKRSTEYCKGNKTVPGKVATTHTEDGHKQNTKQALQYKPKGRRTIGRPRKRQKCFHWFIKCFIPYKYHKTRLSFIPLQSHQYGAMYTILMPDVRKRVSTTVNFKFIHLVVCLTAGPKPLPKRALHIVRSRASSFKWEYLLLSLRSST